jgi:hypothetical protein
VKHDGRLAPWIADSLPMEGVAVTDLEVPMLEGLANGISHAASMTEMLWVSLAG